jgi:hypothetical protein
MPIRRGGTTASGARVPARRLSGYDLRPDVTLVRNGVGIRSAFANFW